jgi:hypothetical protein
MKYLRQLKQCDRGSNPTRGIAVLLRERVINE